jgi:hypothetical protein
MRGEERLEFAFGVEREGHARGGFEAPLAGFKPSERR